MRLPKQVVYVLQKIINTGGQAYLVGGAVRDMLLGRDTLDYDIASSLLPDTIEALFKDHNIYNIGKRFGTIGVIIDDVSIEITTMRGEDKYSDNRHPDSVYFVDSITTDLSRRDFTVNAIAYNPLSVGLLDPFNGKRDLESKILNTVGEATLRFKEDPLRMLRALRFVSQLNFSMSSHTYDAIVKHHSLLDMISRERIRDELSKLLTSPRPDLALMYAQQNGILDMVFPLSDKSMLTCTNLETIKLMEPSLVPRISALVYYLCGFAIQSISKVLKELRYEKSLITHINKFIRGYVSLTDLEASPYNMRKLMGSVGRHDTALLLSWYKHESQTSNNQDMYNKYHKLSSLMVKIINNGDPVDFKELAISGDDVLSAGIGIEKPELVGLALETAYDLVLHKPCLNNKESLINMIKHI